MATSDFISIEKRAEGKSNVFRFVTIRNPETVGLTTDDRRFVRHDDPVKSSFIDQDTILTQKGDYEELRAAANSFSPLTDVAALRALNEDLFVFSDWLVRNRDEVLVQTIRDHTNGVKELTSAQLYKIWDNLFYQIITQKSSVLREALLAVLVGNNFITRYTDTKLITNDNELQQLAGARAVVPKCVLSELPKTISEGFGPEGLGRYNTTDEDAIEEQLNDYRTAIKELQNVNRVFIEELSKQKVADTDAPTGDEITTSNMLLEDLRELVDNPLSEVYLLKYASNTTHELVEKLGLVELKDPLKAIEAIEGEVNVLSKELFGEKRLSKKVISAGGSLIEIDPNGARSNGFTDGCFPTIVDAVNVSVLPSLNRVIATASGAGNAGGASENVINEYGSVSFSMRKLPQGRGYNIGLSPQNTDAHYNTIKYAVQVRPIPSPIGGVIQHGAFALINDAIVGVHTRVQIGDQIRVSRISSLSGPDKILWERFRPSTSSLTIIHEADDQSGSGGLEPLILDFAFTSIGQGVSDLRIDPCDDTGSNGGGPTNENDCSAVTNLGVADYLRVEQEVCCYVPGEVSHIENIMQGEYKERSTRRLRRQETTTTFETETTTEKLRDTTTTDRHEMEQESSQVIQEDSSFELGVTLSTRFGPTKLTVDSGFATSTSSTESNQQAVSYAQEVSTRALDRVVNRVREERINKVIEEFEENNTHGLDNRNNTEGHVSGLYRWVDKIYKNQVVNYGKRLTFEFMIPEPAKFHLWALATEDTEIALERPEDPRENGLPRHTSVTESNYAQWAAQYGVEVDVPPPLYKRIGKAYDKNDNNTNSYAKAYNDLAVPEGYKATNGYVSWSILRQSGYSFSVSLGDFRRNAHDGDFNGSYFFTDIYEGTIPFSFRSNRVYSADLNVNVDCQRKTETLEAWKIDTFNKVIDAYLEKKAAYDNAVSQAQAQASLGIQIQGNNPLYNRTIEQQELQKNCLNWLDVNLGGTSYNEISPCPEVTDMPNLITAEEQACFAQKAKFFEQAFEWDLMSYLFYPYFWGQQCGWKEIYKLDDTDPVFRGFLQAGMARVVVPVRPNYEEALIYFMETGQIWNGGEVPVPEDPLYVSIIDDLAEQDPTPVGDSWETRVPTSLNVLQKNSGAVEGDGLPCNCDNYEADGTGGSTLEGGEDGGVGNFVVS